MLQVWVRLGLVCKQGGSGGGGVGWIGGYPGCVGLNFLCQIILDYGPAALQLLEDFFTDMGWHATFESVFQLSVYCYYPVLRCDVQVGDLFVLVEHRGRDLCGPGVLHTHYP